MSHASVENAAPKKRNSNKKGGTKKAGTGASPAGSKAPVEGTGEAAGGASGAGGTVQLEPPPASANIPAVPVGYVQQPSSAFAGNFPHKMELSTLPAAIVEMTNFTSYTATLGPIAPPHDEIIDTMQVANEWSSMRTAVKAWDQYSLAQEGTAWVLLRSQFARLAPILELAMSTNPSLASQLPNLARLIGAKKVSAKKGASTKSANAAATAAGLQADHGAVGKVRTRKAANAALAAANASSHATSASASPTAAPTGVSPAPVATHG